MPHQANTDANLSRAGDKQRTGGARFLLIGGIMFALGLIAALVGTDRDALTWIGIALMSLAAPPTIAGTALLLSGLVSGRAAKDKPFA